MGTEYVLESEGRKYSLDLLLKGGHYINLSKSTASFSDYGLNIGMAWYCL